MDKVIVVGALKNVMWKGELGSRVDLDTIANKKHLYGLGPESFLKGELLVLDGQIYVSRVTSDTSMVVKREADLSAPFFVYTSVESWKDIQLPDEIKSIPELERFIDEQNADIKTPFTFKLAGRAIRAKIHVQNLPKGTKVSSPEQAHQGQTNYELMDEEVVILGFFSRKHQGIFTHHDSYLHMHLLTKDKSKMGHLDSLEIGKMTLSLAIDEDLR
ncbi:acetolactate decarboxylase [Muriicola sp. E247]|uniref:acetolactate decarboxylase n=1 Tax=Muriicola sp. E247 TaxID=3242730 RepID=UPI003524D389